MVVPNSHLLAGVKYPLPFPARIASMEKSKVDPAAAATIARGGRILAWRKHFPDSKVLKLDRLEPIRICEIHDCERTYRDGN